MTGFSLRGQISNISDPDISSLLEALLDRIENLEDEISSLKNQTEHDRLGTPEWQR